MPSTHSPVRPASSPREIIEADPRMGVDDAERRLLALEIGEDPHQQRVLHDVGEIAGVEGVAVVHARYRTGAISLRRRGSRPDRPRGM